MDNNTILRIKVPAHLYESVKKQLTLKESKKKLSEAISGTDEELMAFYEKVKQMEAEGTDLESAINYAKFDIENPDAAKELSSMNEAKKSGKAFGDWTVVKEKKMKVPKDGMKKVKEEKQEEGYMGTDYAPSEDMAVDMVKKGIKEKDNSMEKKHRTLDELKKAKDALDKKINEMEGMDKVQEVDFGNLMDPNFIGGVAAILGVGVPLVAAAIKDMKKAKTPEEKAAVRQKLAKAAGSALSGDM